MDKEVIFAVAGSGKTRRIVESLDTVKRTVVLTYTNENFNNLRIRILDKFKYWPPNIRLETYFSFLYRFCFLPYFHDSLRVKGISFTDQPKRYVKANTRDFYINHNDKLYVGRLAHLINNSEVIPLVIKRLEKYFEYVFIDEIQDFAGNDFDLLISLFSADISFLCVGDFYQHTFDTSNDGNKNINLHKDFAKYQQRFKDAGVIVDTTTLGNSWRCSIQTCEFVSNNLGISISSNCQTATTVTYIFDNPEKIKQLFSDKNVVKLFYQESYKYPCFGNNWAKSKGLDHYQDVCVVLTKKMLTMFKEDDFSTINPSTRNKLYVACTRARGNLYFIPLESINEHKSFG